MEKERKMFKTSFVRICTWLVLVVFLLTTISACQSAKPQQPDITEEVVNQVTVAPIVTDPSYVETIDVTEEPEEETLVLPLTDVELSDYDPTWEYLEYGDVVEYCQYSYREDNNLPWVHFWVTSEDSDYGFYDYKIPLLPPQFRALKSAIGDDYQGEDFIRVTLFQGVVTSIGDITDKSGNIIWNLESSEEPRDLTTIERAFLRWVDRSGKSKLDYVDLGQKSCEDVLELPFFEGQTPIEYYSRYVFTNELFYRGLPESEEILSIIDDGLLLNCLSEDEVGYLLDHGVYEWVDMEGNTLKGTNCLAFSDFNWVSGGMIILPEDGRITLRKGHVKDGVYTPETEILSILGDDHQVVELAYNGDITTSSRLGYAESLWTSYDDEYLAFLVGVSNNWSEEEIADYFLSQ